MYRKEPKYITPHDTFLAKDVIRPYGGMISDFSTKRMKETVLKLWSGQNIDTKDGK